jgi:hypothetical protein
LLSTPSFAFPYFGSQTAGQLGPNLKFQKFATDFNTKDQFLVDRDTSDIGKLGLINIPYKSIYSDQTGNTLALINQSNQTGSDDTPYETYTAPLLDMLNWYATPLADTTTIRMPVAFENISSGNYFIDQNAIINNFLFATSGTPTSVDVLPGNTQLFKPTGSVLDLTSIYSTTNGSVELFNPNPLNKESTYSYN